MPEFRILESVFRKRRIQIWRSWQSTCIGASDLALAADYKIPAQTATFDCARVKPGDTVTLSSGTRGPLTIRSCNGTAAHPIIIRNDPGASAPTVISRSGGSAGGFLFSCNTCIGVEIDGSYKWNGAPKNKTYGIKITLAGGP